MSENPVFDRIKTEVDDSPVVLFMKGTPDQRGLLIMSTAAA